jgi:hypothetical protein
MAENVPDLTLAERQIVDVISRADRKLAAAVSRALEDATERAAEDMRAIFRGSCSPANVLSHVWCRPGYIRRGKP